MTRLDVPGHVRESQGAHGGAVLLDVRSGHCFAMNSVAKVLWQEWRRSRDFDAGVRVTAQLFPEACHERIQEDARDLVDALVSRGLLATGCHDTEGEGSASAGSTGAPAVETGHRPPDRPGAARAVHNPVSAEVPMAAAPLRPRHTGGGARTTALGLLGLLGLLGALLLIRLPFRTVLRVVEWTGRRWCRREATPSQGAASLAAVRRAAVLYPGRAACLETSLATFMMLALGRRRTDWCIGTAVDPYRFHAWIEAQGTPVRAPDDYGAEAFRRILSV
ncbi:lasso peptide biosynthesis B2 protein [Streptomyces sp. NPDC001340]